MRCPKCGHSNDKVIDSREVREGAAIRRRRSCLQCGYRFTTYEEVIRASLRVLKKDARTEDFDRQKLLNGILRACQKRPVTMEQVEQVVNDIISELEAEYDREVPSAAIGAKVMERLQRLDEVAYVRFASVYRQFKDVNQFLVEVRNLIRRE